MKVLALGGSGCMGRFAVETSMNFENVSEIVVADINAEEALKFANSMNEKVSGIGLDVTDIDALKIVSDGVNSLRDKKRSFLIITHYQRLLDYIKPDFVHVLVGGKIAKTGCSELAQAIEKIGYEEMSINK